MYKENKCLLILISGMEIIHFDLISLIIVIDVIISGRVNILKVRLRIIISPGTLIVLFEQVVDLFALVLFLEMNEKSVEIASRVKPVSLLICLSSACSSCFPRKSGARQSITQCFHNSGCPCSRHTDYLPGCKQHLIKKQIINFSNLLINRMRRTLRPC